MNFRDTIKYVKDNVCEHEFFFLTTIWNSLYGYYDEEFICINCRRKIKQGFSLSEYGIKPEIWITHNDRGDLLKLK